MKKIVCWILIVIFSLESISGISAKTVLSEKQTVDYLYDIYKNETEYVKNPSFGSVGGEWVVFGMARAGLIEDNYIDTYKKNLKMHIKDCKGVLSQKKYAEYARVVIALTSIGENPTNFAGYHLLEPLAEFDKLVSNGPNALMYGLIALDCGNYDIPKPKSDYSGTVTTRELLIATILDYQLEDGGWCLSGKKADVDLTSMAIQALAPYYKSNHQVKKALDRALNQLGVLQQNSGAYKMGKSETCETTAQVLTAMSEMGISIEDKRFVKNGHTVIDGLLQFYQNGAFKHLLNGNRNQMATEQAMYALVSYERSITGRNRLYDLSDGIQRKTLEFKEQSKAVEKSQTKEKGAAKKSKGKKVSKASKEESSNVETFKSSGKKETESQKPNSETGTKKEKNGVTFFNPIKTNETISSREKQNAKEQSKDSKKTKRILLIVGGIAIILFMAGGIRYFLCFKPKRKK